MSDPSIYGASFSFLRLPRAWCTCTTTTTRLFYQSPKHRMNVSLLTLAAWQPGSLKEAESWHQCSIGIQMTGRAQYRGTWFCGHPSSAYLQHSSINFLFGAQPGVGLWPSLRSSGMYRHHLCRSYHRTIHPCSGAQSPRVFC